VRFRKEIANRFVEYAAILTAISKDSWRSSKSNTLFFILLSVVHIASLSLSAYFLFYMMRELTALHEIEAADRKLANSYLALAAFFTGLVISALSSGTARRIAIKLANQVNVLNARRIVKLLASLPRCDSLFANHLVARGRFRGLATNDSRFCGVTARLLLLMLPELGLALGALAIMLYFEQLLTLVLGLISILLALVQVPVSLGIAEASRKLEQTNPEFKRNFSGLMGRVDRVSDITDEELSKLEEDYKFPYNHFSQYYRRFLFTEYSTVVAQLSSAIVFCIVILAVLYRAGTGKLDLAVLLLFVACARQALASVAKVTRSLVAISRVFPQVSRYFRFVWSATDSWPLLVSQEEVRYSSRSELQRYFTTSNQSLGGATAPVRPEEVYRVFAPSGLTRVAAAAIFDELGFSPGDLSEYEPRIGFANKTLNGNTLVDEAPKPPAKTPWHICLTTAGIKAEQAPYDPKQALIRTELVFSAYDATDSPSADVYVVLSPDHYVVLQTSDRLHAFDFVKTVMCKHPKSADGGMPEDVILGLDEES
jgi:ABC-type multidrug transport system fused ATPase/permease subunit